MDRSNLRRHVFSSLIACAILLSGIRITEAVVIEKDTVWKGQLRFDEEVVVNPGVTLLVEPGTSISFARTEPPSALKVQGKIIAQGTVAEPIVFTSAAQDPQPGDWQGIVLNDTREEVNRFRHIRIAFAQTGVQGARARLVLEDSVVEKNKTGLSLLQGTSGGAFGCLFERNSIGCEWIKNSDFNLKHSRIENSHGDGLRCDFQSAPALTDNVIIGNAKNGISCLNGSSPQIKNNLVTTNQTGIFVQKRSRPGITNNDLVDNQIAVWVEKRGNPKISKNRIFENDIGVYCNLSGIPLLHGNHIEANRQFAIALGENQSQVADRLLSLGGHKRFPEKVPNIQKRMKERLEGKEKAEMNRGKIDARENWWGSAVTEAMLAVGDQADLKIFQDSFDKPNVLFLDHHFPLDQVAYAPWREEPLEGVGRQVFPKSGIEGQVLFKGRPLKGARVHVFRDPQGEFQGEGFSYSPPTDENGHFSLHLAPGEYYLITRKTAAKFPGVMPSTGDFLGDYPENPMKVEESKLKEVQISIHVLK